MTRERSKSHELQSVDGVPFPSDRCYCYRLSTGGGAGTQLNDFELNTIYLSKINRVG